MICPAKDSGFSAPPPPLMTTTTAPPGLATHPPRRIATAPWKTVGVYLFAVALSGACLWVRSIAGQLFGEGNWFIQSYPAIALAAAVGGLGPGLLATALSVLGVLYFFVPPVLSVQLTAQNLPPLITFAGIGALISALNEKLQRSTRHAARAEQRYRQLIDMTPVAVFVNLDDRIVYANDAMHRLVGATTLTGEAPLALVHQDFRDAVKQRIGHLRRGELPFGPPMQQVWLRKDGTEVTVESTATVVAWGEKQAIQVVLRDTTEEWRIAEERERLLKQSQQANAAKDDFLASLSHELRTPINAILGWARMAREQTPGVSTARALEVIERNAETQARLVNELLDLSQITTGSMQILRDPLDLRDPIRAAIQAVTPLANAADVRIDAGMPAEVMVLGESVRLQQVAWNLLTNAIKFSSAGACVHVSLRQHGDEATLTVADRGQGISAEFLPHVFERFRHEDPNRTRSTPGFGIGLAIVQHIVQAHGGSIHAASAGPGSGATFVVTLPVIAGARDEERRS